MLDTKFIIKNTLKERIHLRYKSKYLVIAVSDLEIVSVCINIDITKTLPTIILVIGYKVELFSFDLGGYSTFKQDTINCELPMDVSILEKVL